MGFLKFNRKRAEVKPSMRRKLFLSLGSLAAILLLSGVISIIEYRRMSDYVSELIAANIKSINLSQKLADLTQEYNDQMLAVVVQNDISMMPDFQLDYFNAQSDSLRNSFTSQKMLHKVDSVVISFDAFMKTSSSLTKSFWLTTWTPASGSLEASSHATPSSAPIFSRSMKSSTRNSRRTLLTLMQDSTGVSFLAWCLSEQVFS